MSARKSQNTKFSVQCYGSHGLVAFVWWQCSTLFTAFFRMASCFRTMERMGQNQIRRLMFRPVHGGTGAKSTVSDCILLLLALYHNIYPAVVIHQHFLCPSGSCDIVFILIGTRNILRQNLLRSVLHKTCSKPCFWPIFQQVADYNLQKVCYNKRSRQLRLAGNRHGNRLDWKQTLHGTELK